jgi:ankyrin repeat protein
MSYAAQDGSLGIIKRLIEAGADVDIRNVKQATPLILAANWGKPECVAYLLKQGADIHARTLFGDTPLLLASRTATEPHTECVQMLLKAGSEANARNPDGETPLLLAAQAGAVETMKALLEAGANPEEPRTGRPKPLPIYRGRGKVPMMGLGNVPGPTQKRSNSASTAPARTLQGMLYFSFEGDTPLFYAAMFGRQDVARLLLAHGAKVNTRNTRGETPLHVAAAHGQPEMTKLLLQAGADSTLTNQSGDTPLRIAERNDDVMLARLFSSMK